MSSPKVTLTKKLSEIAGHPLSWLGLTLFIVLIAYVWMDQATNEIVNEPVKKLAPSKASTDVEQAENIIKQENMDISKSSDAERAQEFLEVEFIENSIDPLFLAANGHMDLGQYVLPENDNAWNDFQQIITISPDNTRAKSGQTKIRNLLIDNADTALEEGDFASAENWLVQLDIIEPDGEIQKDIRSDIKAQIEAAAQAKLAAQKQQEKMLKIENTLSQAKELEEEFPINYNKINDLYNRVLELDPENSRASKGLENLIDIVLDQGEQSLRDDKLEESKAYLDRAKSIDPDNKRLSSIELALETKLSQVAQLEQQALEKLAKEQAEDQAQKQTEAQNNATQPSTESTSAQTPSVADDTDAIDKIVTDLENSVVVEDVTAEELATQQEEAALIDGIKAYYDGNYNKSFELLYSLAESGMARAQFRIGVMYRYGRSVTQNSDLSEKWFTRALPSILNSAQRGIPWAQTDLGTAYELGISLQQDFERAAFWYKKAAEQDYPGAQTNLGVLYANGEGVAYSRSQAVFWLKKAAKQGDLVAIENLRIMGVSY